MWECLTLLQYHIKPRDFIYAIRNVYVTPKYLFPLHLNICFQWVLMVRCYINKLFGVVAYHGWQEFRSCSDLRSLQYDMWAVTWKTNKVTVRPAKTRISLGFHPVWSESSMSTWRNLGSLATHWAHSEDSDQTGQVPRLIWVFAGCTVILLVLSCRGSCSDGCGENWYRKQKIFF